MKVCIIGSSGHFGYVFEGIKHHKNVFISGVAPGSDGETIDNLYDEMSNFGIPFERYADYRKMLDVVKPHIAVITCFFGDHPSVIIECIQRGIHVFSEKPIATTVEDLERVKRCYEKVNIHLTTMLAIRYTPWFLTAKKAVDENEIGEIRLMNAQKSYKLGNRQDFYKKRHTYGGTIPWVGIHAIDWLGWFSGESFCSVLASHSTKNNREHGDLEVTALCHFTLTNDVFGSVTIDYLRPETAPSHDDDRLRIVGTRGIIEVRDKNVFLINNGRSGVQELPLLPGREIFIDFLEQVKGNSLCMVSAEDAFKITEVCLKTRQSADENRIIYLKKL